MTPLERSTYILMERIFPPISKGSLTKFFFNFFRFLQHSHPTLGYVVRPGGPSPPELSDLISELGIFGAIIGFVTSDKTKFISD